MQKAKTTLLFLIALLVFSILTCSSCRPGTRLRENARRGLSWADSLVKAGEGLATDTLLRYSVEYYSRWKNSDEYLQSLYYRGLQYYQSGDLFSAAPLLDMALKIATEREDWKTCGRCSRALGYIFRDNYNSVEEVSRFEDACHFFDKAGLREHFEAARFQLALSYKNDSRYEESRQIYKGLLEESDSASSLGEIMSCYADAILSDPDSDSSLRSYARTLLLEALADTCYRFTSFDYGLLALSTAEAGDFVHASELIGISADIAGNANQKGNVKFREYQIATLMGDYQKALSILQDCLERQDSIVTTVLSDGSTVALKDYYARLSEQEHIRSRILVLIVGILSLVFLVILLTVVIVYQGNVRNLQDKSLAYSELLARVELLSKESRVNTSLFSLERLCSAYNPSSGRILLSEIESFFDSLRRGGEEEEQFEKMLDLSSGYVISGLRREVPSANENDILLFCLFLSGLSTQSVSKVLGISRENVYNRLSRLRKKISSDSLDPNKYLKYITINEKSS